MIIPKYKNGEKACTPIKVCQFSLKNSFIKEYSSIKEAGLETHTSPKGISLCCRGLQKTSNNFYWRYANEQHIPILYFESGTRFVQDNR